MTIHNRERPIIAFKTEVPCFVLLIFKVEIIPTILADRKLPVCAGCKKINSSACSST